MPDVLLRSEESDGVVSVVDNTVPANWPGPFLHRHDFDEAFYVLEGELEIDVDGVTSVARTGSFVLAPSGLPHAFRVMSDTARVLSISSAPTGNTNGGFPAFLKEVGEPAQSLTLPQPEAPDPGLLVSAAETHALEILPPPGP